MFLYDVVTGQPVSPDEEPTAADLALAAAASVPVEQLHLRSLEVLSLLVENGGIAKAGDLIAKMSGSGLVRDDNDRLLEAIVHVLSLRPDKCLEVTSSIPANASERVRGTSAALRSFAFAFIGQESRSLQQLDAARALIPAGEAAILNPGLAARALAEWEKADSARMREALSEFHVDSDSAVSKYMAYALDSIAKTLEGRSSEAITILSRIVRREQWAQKDTRPGSFLHWYISAAQLIEGLPGAALDDLDAGVYSRDHLVCWPAIRAQAWLSLGQSRLALAELESCRRVTQHNPRTRAQGDWVKAVALRTSNVRRSKQIVARLLSSEFADRRLALELLPTTIASEFAASTGIESGNAGLRGKIDRTYESLGELSERELATLSRLTGGASFESLARTAHISSNTLRTHVRAIYRKLGVGGRAEAVDAALTAGVTANLGGRVDALIDHTR